MITITETGRTLSRTFDSLSEYADYAEQFLGNVDVLRDAGSDWAYGEDGHHSNHDATHLARNGWQSKEAEAFELIESAIDQIEREFEMPKWTPEWDVTGGSVDVGAYLAGVPECMIEYPVTEVSSIGRVVAICSSVSASGSIDAKELIARGTMIAALAMMLERYGYNTEIWADLSASGTSSYKIHDRVLVKSAKDMIDPSRILYAVANPSMLRILGFAAMWGLPQEYRRALGVGSSYGMPAHPKRDLPEGALYMKELLSYHSYDAKAELISNLRTLGIIE